MHRDKAPKIVRLWITWWTMWITCRKKCGQSRCIPCIKATGSHFVHPLARREEGRLFLFFFRSFSFCERKRTKRKLRNLLRQYRRARPSAALAFPAKIFCGAFLSEKPRRENLFSFLSGERKENQKRKPGTRLGWPAAPARQRRLPSPQKIFCGAFLSEKPRREKWVTDEGGGLPDCFRANPSPIRFLFFGSFFSFSERKERTIPPTAARTPRGGPPAGLRASPSPLRFLFFGSFFSFPERKERT